MSEGVKLIDCQVYTEYLESFGAAFISRSEFVKLIQHLVSK
jgi:leucyl/phenylalanyl-tRNA--protein transferase